MKTKSYLFLCFSVLLAFAGCNSNHPQNAAPEPINISKSIDYQLYKLNVKYDEQGQETCDKYQLLKKDSIGGLDYYGLDFQKLISQLLQQQHIDIIPRSGKQPSRFFHLVYKPHQQADSLAYYTIAKDIANHYGYRITDSIIDYNAYMLSFKEKMSFMAKYQSKAKAARTIEIVNDKFKMSNISLQAMVTALSEYYNADFAIATPDTTLYTLDLLLPGEVSAFCMVLEKTGFAVEVAKKKKKVFRLEREVGIPKS